MSAADLLVYSVNGLLLSLVVTNSIKNTKAYFFDHSISEDGFLNFTGIAEKYGYTSEQRRVVSDDGYILTMFHIPGDRRRPVLLVPGLLHSADSFILRASASPALALAAQGYDVWVTDSRGGRYSRTHVRLDPDTNKRFWDFSFHEQAYYDIPTVIDYVLTETDQDSLYAIGHSQGSQVFFALGSLRPEYNDRIRILIALGPLCLLSHAPSPISELIKAAPAVNQLAEALGIESFGNNSGTQNFFALCCAREFLSSAICSQGIMETLSGSDVDELLPTEFAGVIRAHFPCNTSRKNLVHVAQIGQTGKFAQFDFGIAENLVSYKQVEPPEYDLKQVTMKVALLVGKKDHLSDLQDVEWLKATLPNVVNYTVIPREECTHFDFVWGLHMSEYLLPFIFEILEKH